MRSSANFGLVSLELARPSLCPFAPLSYFPLFSCLLTLGAIIGFGSIPALDARADASASAASLRSTSTSTGELIASKRSAFFINDFPPFPLSLSLFFFSLFPFPLADDASALWITLRPRFAPFPPTASDPPTRARAPDGANDPPTLVRAPLIARGARETTSRPRAPTVTAGPPPRAVVIIFRPLLALARDASAETSNRGRVETVLPPRDRARRSRAERRRERRRLENGRAPPSRKTCITRARAMASSPRATPARAVTFARHGRGTLSASFARARRRCEDARATSGRWARATSEAATVSTSTRARESARAGDAALAVARRFAEVVRLGSTIALVALDKRRYDELGRAVGALGPAYAKFGQALASRGDIVGRDVARALMDLCDDMEPFDDEAAVRVVEEELGVESPVAAAVRDAGPPVAAASLAQVYKATLDGETVAIKVQRPGIEAVVDMDAALLRLGASAVERTGKVKAKALDAVNEFCSRLYEEMDFRREAANLTQFNALYGENGSASKSFPKPGIRVPRLIDTYGVGRRVVVMEWIDGEKLTRGRDKSVSADDLHYVKLGIACTLSQLIETGVMHADPHGGNILKLPNGGLAYLDFGLVSTVPRQVRDGLVAAIALLIFSRNYAAVGRLFGELMLIPPEVLEDESEMRELERALEDAAEATLKFPENGGVPDVRFDQLLGALLALVPRFKFILPPYFLNNARALGTLEGMAKSADPDFNILAVVYPYAMTRALANPDESPVIRSVIRQLATDPTTDRLSLRVLFKMLRDVSRLTGASALRVAVDALARREGRRLLLDVLAREFRNILDSIRRLRVRPHR